MKPQLTDTSGLGKEKVFANKDTSYSSFWLYNNENDVLSKDFKDKVVAVDPKIFSEFNPAVAKNVISYWSNPGDVVLDPFAGRTRGFISGAMNRKYYGFELVKETYDYLKNHDTSQLQCQPTFINDDSHNIDNHPEIPMADLIFTCPPYWDIERYSDLPNDLSNMSYCYFIERLAAILVKSSAKLKVGGYMAIVIGDFRAMGEYNVLHSDLLMRMYFENSYLPLHDLVVIQNLPFHVGAIYFGNMKKVKKVSKVHEYLLIYKKVK